MLISLASEPESPLTVFTGAIKKAVKEKVKHMNITIEKKLWFPFSCKQLNETFFVSQDFN